ncbi:MAG: hypothetical protein ACW985_04890 [Candidatus Thorarchaeota archaeon]
MNERIRAQRSSLLRRYYKSASLGWFHPKSLHWAKVVTSTGHWKWIRADKGVRGRLLRDPPLHIYQTVLRFKSSRPPRGKKTEGYLMGGPFLFDADLIEKDEPFSLWKMVDSGPMIQELIQTFQDRGEFKAARVMFSGFRGIHVALEDRNSLESPIQLLPDQRNRDLQTLLYIRKQTARTIGYWCPGWDWRVSADVYRVARVPWSLHGKSALRAVPLKPPYEVKNIRDQLSASSLFSSDKNLRVRMKRYVPHFVFVDGESYGPYRKGWTTKLPISVALHLIWQGLAKPRESGPSQVGNWFSKDWQTLFRYKEFGYPMDSLPVGGAGG